MTPIERSGPTPQGGGGRVGAGAPGDRTPQVGLEPKTFGSPPGQPSDSGDPAAASAHDAGAPGYADRAARECDDFAQLGLARAGLVNDSAADAPAAAPARPDRSSPITEQDLNDIAADDVGASAMAERAQKESERGS
jgi:hypothetical protein